MALKIKTEVNILDIEPILYFVLIVAFYYLPYRPSDGIRVNDFPFSDTQHFP
jgi:hypothetical protein